MHRRFFVKRIPFLLTVSKHLQFDTVNTLSDRRNDTNMSALRRVFRTYRQRGFQIILVKADREFEHLDTRIAGLGAQLNCCNEDEHVPEIDRYIRTVKEHVAVMFMMSPFHTGPVPL
jgi:hypothetical protein